MCLLYVSIKFSSFLYDKHRKQQDNLSNKLNLFFIYLILFCVSLHIPIYIYISKWKEKNMYIFYRPCLYVSSHLILSQSVYTRCHFKILPSRSRSVTLRRFTAKDVSSEGRKKERERYFRYGKMRQPRSEGLNCIRVGITSGSWVQWVQVQRDKKMSDETFNFSNNRATRIPFNAIYIQLYSNAAMLLRHL